jgi:ubiquinone/menaquinone biosynthesis C-methylase UbiE
MCTIFASTFDNESLNVDNEIITNQGGRMELNELYSQFNEELRLSKNRSSRIEFYTTMNFIKKYLRAGDRVLDIGAGTGVYPKALADLGHNVTAIELASPNVIKLRESLRMMSNVEIIEGNALDLSTLEDQSFDFVLCLGPLYHLSSVKDKMKCVSEAKRVCKKGGCIFFAYISNDMVFITETMLYNQTFLNSDHYEIPYKVKDGPFCFMTVGQMRQLMKKSGLEKVNHFAADGLSELLSEKINSMSEDQFVEWLNFHFYTCEKSECLGFSNHIVYVARNKKG